MPNAAVINDVAIAVWKYGYIIPNYPKYVVLHVYEIYETTCIYLGFSVQTYIIIELFCQKINTNNILCLTYNELRSYNY